MRLHKDAVALLCFAAVVLACVGVVGCTFTPPSMNVQRSGIRGVGDLAVTATLDAQDAATAEALVPKIVKACDEIEAILASPDGFTLGGFVEAVKAKLPVGTEFLADEIVKAVGADKTRTLLGAADVKYILALVRGARRGAEGYAAGDRKAQS